MKIAKFLNFLFVFTILISTGCEQGIKYKVNNIINKNKPRIAFTIDDGLLEDYGNYKFEVWNQMLLDNLKKTNTKVIFFPSYANKSTKKGNFLLESWNNAGHTIGNHTFNHVDFNAPGNNTSILFETELLTNEKRISKLSNFKKIFRFPYLHEGNTIDKLSNFRTILKKNGYKNGHVSIDCTDWYIDLRLQAKLRQNPNADLSGFRDYYLSHVYQRALYYESLSYKINKRHVDHVLLLHHNILGAFFLDDLINHFKNNGWEIVDAKTAYQDKIYNTQLQIIPSGQSLIWSMAKNSGNYDKELRFPAEGQQYEQLAMTKLGL